MNRKAWHILWALFFLCTGVVGAAQGGQFVTEADRAWAKKALQEEKGLKSIDDGARTLAVLYFHNKSGWSGLDLLRKGLSLMLITDLSKLKEITLIERTKIEALKEEMGLGTEGMMDPDTAPRLGRLLGASLLVGGDIVKVKPEVFGLMSDVLIVLQEKSLGSPAVDGKLLEELFRMEKDLVFEIIELLKIKLTPEQRKHVEQPITESLEALLYWFEAIEEGDKGNLDKAKDLLGKVSEADPGFPDDLIAYDPRGGEDGADRGSDSGGSSIDGGGGGGGKACAAARNKLLRNSLKRRRW